MYRFLASILGMIQVQEILLILDSTSDNARNTPKIMRVAYGVCLLR